MQRRMDAELQAHPAACEFPMMDSKRYQELVEDIRDHGQLEPITLFDGQILDGRNRYRACLELEIAPKTKTYSGNPWAYAWSLNGQRRDLVAEQRYLLWKFFHEQSDAWQTEKQRIADEANRKRSEAAKEQPRTETGFAGKQVVEQSVPPPDASPEKAHKQRATKAKASKTNKGAVQRGDQLAAERPDLAEKVRKGEMKPAEAHRQMKKAKVKDKVAELPKDKFRVIYAAPPWKYNDNRDVNVTDYTGAEHHYPTMTIAELCALPVQELAAPDAVLFLWVTSPLLYEAAPLIKAWGFSYKSSYVWDKVKHNMGHYNSVRHELLLICTRGSCTPDTPNLNDSVVSIERAQRHSEKPEEFRRLIDSMYPHGQRIELFRRGAAPDGWSVWGNEADAA